MRAKNPRSGVVHRMRDSWTFKDPEGQVTYWPVCGAHGEVSGRPEGWFVTKLVLTHERVTCQRCGADPEHDGQLEMFAESQKVVAEVPQYELLPWTELP